MRNETHFTLLQCRHFVFCSPKEGSRREERGGEGEWRGKEGEGERRGREGREEGGKGRRRIV